MKLKSKVDTDGEVMVSFHSIVVFGLMFSYSNLFVWWNYGLFNDFSSYCISTAIISFAFINLNLCIGELTSILPFAGGNYGFVRLAISPVIGFIVGMLEVCSNLFYVMNNIAVLCSSITYVAFNKSYVSALDVALWFGFLLTANVLYFFGPRIYLRIVEVIGTLAILIFVVYILATSGYMNTARYIPYSNGSKLFGDYGTFGDNISMSAWWFIGIESLPLYCHHVPEPRKTIPQAMLLCTMIMTISAFVLMVAVCSQYPGASEVYYFDDYTALFNNFPMNPGFQRLFDTTSSVLSVLSFPALLLSPICFLFAGAQQFSAISASRLLPVNLATGRWKNAAVPTFSLLVLVVMLIIWVLQSSAVFTDTIGGLLFAVAELCSCSVYIFILIGYCIFKAEYGTYPSLQPYIKNPFGFLGAFYGIIVFSLQFIDQLLFYREDNSFDTCKIFGCIVGASMVYYYCFARKRQTYSEEEKATLLKVYTIRANKSRMKIVISKKTVENRRKKGLFKRPSMTEINQSISGKVYITDSTSQKPLATSSRSARMSSKNHGDAAFKADTNLLRKSGSRDENNACEFNYRVIDISEQNTS